MPSTYANITDLLKTDESLKHTLGIPACGAKRFYRPLRLFLLAAVCFVGVTAAKASVHRPNKRFLRKNNSEESDAVSGSGNNDVENIVAQVENNDVHAPS